MNKQGGPWFGFLDAEVDQLAATDGDLLDGVGAIGDMDDADDNLGGFLMGFRVEGEAAATFGQGAEPGDARALTGTGSGETRADRARKRYYGSTISGRYWRSPDRSGQ